jgi:uncharacterized membrane protein YeaQ/YmgE (transglycosylase-associated protein family)
VWGVCVWGGFTPQTRTPIHHYPGRLSSNEFSIHRRQKMSVTFLQILILIGIMIIVGVIVGFIAGFIWKNNRPIGVKGDYLVAILSAIVIGLLDWFVIPAMGFSNTMRLLGVIIEPPLGALAVLWVIRIAKK